MPSTYAQRRLAQILAENPDRALAHAQLREREAKLRARVAHVYVFPAREYVKVGIAADVKDRWQTLRTGNPLLEAPIYVSESAITGARKIELAAHLALAAYRVTGTEWFRCNRYFAAELVEQIFKQGAPI